MSREFYLTILDLNVAYVDSYLAVTIIGGWYSVRYIINNALILSFTYKCT